MICNLLDKLTVFAIPHCKIIVIFENNPLFLEPITSPMNIVRKLFILATILIQFNNLHAEHVVGANVSYTAISSDANTFTIELTVSYLVDCAEANNQGFPVLVYTHNETTDQYSFNTAFYLDINDANNLDNLEYDCLAVPNNLCTRQLRASHERTFPIIDESYIFVHSSCCRNAANINIIDPLDNGLTIFEVITSFDQQNLNSSPQLDATTSLTICSNEFTNYELPISDPDGDSLAIKLCQPEFMGQGQQHAPPYPPLVFNEAAGYNFENPLGGTGTIDISESGQALEIIASQQGQYAMAICVEEYRNGVLLGLSKLELQIVVLDCLNVQANANTDFTEPDGVEVIVLCEENQFQLTNNSFPTSIITEQLWTIENEEVTMTFTEWEPLVTFPSGGEYTGTLIVRSIFDCPDTLHLKFRVNPFLEVDFEVDSLSCDTDEVSIFDRTNTDAPIADHLYVVNGDSFFTSSPLVNFPEIGTYDIQYHVVDAFGCMGSTTESFYYDPTIHDIEIEIEEETTSCIGKFFTPTFNTEDFDDWIFEDQPWTSEILITEPSYHTVVATKDGCYFSKTFFVTPLVCEAKIYIPNVFSPNDDGFNDTFGPYGDDFEIITFTVFDRWGNQVFGTVSNNTFWDGKLKGKFVNPGIYAYSIRYRETELGTELVAQGTVTLVR